MNIKKEHRDLLKALGLKDADFEQFDGENVRYEYDQERGVRIYDPYYRTSYDEYMDVDGWSSWSSEQDTFMSDILGAARETMEGREKINPKPTREEIAKSVQDKFGGEDDSE